MAEYTFQTINDKKITVDKTVVQEFATSLRGPLLQQGDAGYDEARAVWNGMIDRHPALIARCQGTADVMEAVRFAAAHDILTSVHGGGHNVAGHAVATGGLMIDLSPMKGIYVDPQARTVRVEGGATWADLDHETQPFGLAVPGGVISTTGVAGLTLGGGYGWLRRKYGLTCDHLLSADVVTAEGKLLTASEDENPDLFWALRGGGGNFGVVTSFQFSAQPVGPLVSTAIVYYPFAAADQVLRGWRDFMADAPDEISANAMLYSIQPVPDFPAELHGQPICIVIAMYAGPVEEGQQALQPLRELAEPVADASRPLPYKVVNSMFDRHFPEGDLRYYWKSLELDTLDEDAIETLIEHAQERPSTHSLIDLWALGGAVEDVQASATAFGDRSASYIMVLNTSWADPAQDQANINWARGLWQAMHPFSPGSTYLNFPGFGEEGERMVQDAYGENYQRLVDIKRRYDPRNLFRLNQNITPQPEAVPVAAD